MAIKKGIAFLCLLFYPIIIFAQYIDIGFRINQITRFNYETFSDVNLSSNLININSSHFSADIIDEQISIKNNIYRFRVGINKTLAKSYSNAKFPTGEYINIQESDYFEYRFAVGVGKLYEYKKIIFKVGLELPFNYQNSRHYYRKTEEYDVNGNIKNTTINNFDEPKHSYIGLFMFTSIYYNFWKSFSTGFELSNGFFYGYRSEEHTSELQSH